MESKEIIERIKDGKRKKLKTYPCHVVRASEIGHPCERYNVYCITNWQDKKPVDAELQFIFEGGNAIEEMAIKDFEDAGFTVYRPEPDTSVQEKTPKITGHYDIRVDFGDQRVRTGEIKGLNIYDFDKLNTIEDFYNSKKVWVRKYPAQLMSYMYMKNEDEGFFYLKSIPRFQPKLIWVKLDYTYMESILKKTERIYAHIAAQTLPDRVKDYEICEYCPFSHICLPDIVRSDMVFMDSAEMEGMLNRRDELKEYAREYDEIDGQLKKSFAEKEKISCGNWLITGKWIVRKSYTVPESKYIKYSILKVL